MIHDTAIVFSFFAMLISPCVLAFRNNKPGEDTAA